MHEHSKADRLMQQAIQMAEEKGLETLSEVVIGIGAMTGLSQEVLQEQLKHVAAHLELKNVQYQFHKILPEAVCRGCNKNIGTQHACPHCGGRNIKIIAGLDVEVMAVN